MGSDLSRNYREPNSSPLERWHAIAHPSPNSMKASTLHKTSRAGAPPVTARPTTRPPFCIGKYQSVLARCARCQTIIPVIVSTKLPRGLHFCGELQQALGSSTFANATAPHNAPQREHPRNPAGKNSNQGPCIHHNHSTPSPLLARAPAITRIDGQHLYDHPCRQELQPVLGPRDSQHGHSTPSELLARTRASAMFHGFTTATAPHHPCWQELTLVLCSIIHHSHSTPSVLARTPPSTKFLHAAPERPIGWQGTLANTRIHGCITSAVLAKTLATTRIHRCSAAISTSTRMDPPQPPQKPFNQN